MQTTPLVLLAGSTVLLLCSVLLILTMREKRRLQRLIKKEQERNRTFALLFNEVDNMLASIKWHTEMMRNKEAGKISIAQQQLLNKVDTSVVDAIKLLKKHFKITSKDCKKPQKES